ncbi:class I SAM-dependent methyltransferase [Candidatus Woesearchaeota archaeon]|nr:class I SAM-dependent methyltransferase [Candidatus Woesearchaeota archaeon]MCF7900775.1 class I SAM-dependent methyltransferase [Candidatus Woesearchaeota archaeon]MCF8012940.1 class I SAM-dependent methyltransferase [Candidatus Woesearchaeota archaeon]
MKKNDFEFVTCDYCKSRKFKKIFESKDYVNFISGKFQVVKCLNCGLVFTNPRPNKSKINYFYPDSSGYYQPEKPKENKGIIWNLNKLTLKYYFDYFSNKNKNKLKKIVLYPLLFYKIRDFKIKGIPLFKENGNILDIGCSYADFLYFMKQLGWKTTGVEMNKTAASWANKNFKVNVKINTLNKFNTQTKYDAITMRMYLEHSYSPYNDLVKVRNMLTKNGELIIIIPNFNGLESKIYKKYAYTLQLPTHLTHFTEDSIKKYLKKIGFKEIKIYHHKTDRDLIAPLTILKTEGKDIKILRLLLTNKIIRKTLVKAFINILSILRKTSRITIYAKK